MPNGLGATFRSGVLNYILRGAATPGANTYYVSLHTGDPGADGATVNEPVGNNYSRVTITTLGTVFTATTTADPNVLANATTIAFPTASGAWGTITYWGLWKASTGNAAADFVGAGLLTGSQVVGSGNTPTFTAAQLSMTINLVSATGLGRTFRKNLYDYLFRAGTDPLNALGNTFVSLHTLDPGTDGQTSTEATGTGYARVTVPRNTTVWSAATVATPSVITNGTLPVTFALAGANWSSGTAMTYFGIWSTLAGVGTTDFLCRGTITSQVINSGNTPSFATSTLTTRLDSTP